MTDFEDTAPDPAYEDVVKPDPGWWTRRPWPRWEPPQTPADTVWLARSVEGLL